MDSSKVVRLNTTSNNLLATLEDLTERVKQGDIDGFAVAAVTKDGHVLTGSCYDDQIYTLLGAVVDLRRTIEDDIER
jgi:phage head maturation protease